MQAYPSIKPDTHSSARPELVSIIIPCYNAAEWIKEAIDSCLAQTYKPIEIIVVDDGSTDNSVNIVSLYGDSVHIERGVNLGGSVARNRGFAISKGDYVIFLDADDFIAPRMVETLIKELWGTTNTVAACRWWYFILKDTVWVPVEGRLLEPNKEDPLYCWLEGYFIPCHALLWPREIIENIGGWDETLTANQDGDLMFRALLNGAKLITVNEGGAYYRKYGASYKSVSTSTSQRSIESRFRVLDKLQQRLVALNLLDLYSLPLSWAYHGLAINSFGVSTSTARECVRRARRLAGFHSVKGTFWHRVGCFFLGLENKERLSRSLASVAIIDKIRSRTLLRN